MSRRILPAALMALLATAACASHLQSNQRQVEIPGRPGALRPDAATTTAIPPGVTLDDGLTQDEAVSVALWNNAAFRTQLTDLGFARADLLEAGLLKNPVLSLLFPIGPKQLEATLRLPIEVLWERPKRVAASTRAVDRVAAGLEQDGLNLVADVRLAFVELSLARERARLARDGATQFAEIQKITDARLRAGDISELEARTAAIDAARAAQDAIRAEYDAEIRLNALRNRLGLSLEEPVRQIVLTPSTPAASDAAACSAQAAFASRPDVRAAEIAVEAAAARMGFEKSRILSLTAVLDANGAGKEGFEMGPGIDLSIPIFDRNDAGRARAAAEMQRAALGYVAARQRVATEVADASIAVAQARAGITAWQRTIVGPLEQQVAAAQRAYADGDVSQLFVLDVTRRLTDAQIRARDVAADLERALIRLERAVGRGCSAPVGS